MMGIALIRKRSFSNNFQYRGLAQYPHSVWFIAVSLQHYFFRVLKGASVKPGTAPEVESVTFLHLILQCCYSTLLVLFLDSIHASTYNSKVGVRAIQQKCYEVAVGDWHLIKKALLARLAVLPASQQGPWFPECLIYADVSLSLKIIQICFFLAKKCYFIHM